MKINYVIKKSRRRSMSIRVAENKIVTVNVPLGTPDSLALEFVSQKKVWILRQLERIYKEAAFAFYSSDKNACLSEESTVIITANSFPLIRQI